MQRRFSQYFAQTSRGPPGPSARGHTPGSAIRQCIPTGSHPADAHALTGGSHHYCDRVDGRCSGPGPSLTRPLWFSRLRTIRRAGGAVLPVPQTWVPPGPEHLPPTLWARFARPACAAGGQICDRIRYAHVPPWETRPCSRRRYTRRSEGECDLAAVLPRRTPASHTVGWRQCSCCEPSARSCAPRGATSPNLARARAARRTNTLTSVGRVDNHREAVNMTNRLHRHRIDERVSADYVAIFGNDVATSFFRAL